MSVFADNLYVFKETVKRYGIDAARQSQREDMVKLYEEIPDEDFEKIMRININPHIKALRKTNKIYFLKIVRLFFNIE